ncbi:uncharacterized protein IL334_002501 [Kwoniella shivajii]|uniref:Uncharacterized protein n=1 Tax=Kwoniella shivajii TaxID=564305 RepID=A0ABZ1CXZ5_9TREE|nr:hypothetical protein IL334_002501 [Kwoniella shivajii]
MLATSIFQGHIDTSETELSLALRDLFKPIVKSLHNVDHNSLAVAFGGVPSMANVRSRNIVDGQTVDLFYEESRFVKDLRRYKTEYNRIFENGSPVPHNYGTNSPDIAVFCFTEVEPADVIRSTSAGKKSAAKVASSPKDIASPRTQTPSSSIPILEEHIPAIQHVTPPASNPPLVPRRSWAQVVADPTKQASQIQSKMSEIPPSNIFLSPNAIAGPSVRREKTRAGRSDPKKNPSSGDRKIPATASVKPPSLPPKRPQIAKKGSQTSLEAQKNTKKKIFILPSLVGELKDITTPVEKVVCQGLAYLLTANEIAGTYIGLLIRGYTFAIVIALTPDVYIVKSASSLQETDGNIKEPVTLDEYLQECSGLPDSFGTMEEPNLSGIRTVWQLLCHAAELIVDHPLHQPLPALKIGDSPLIHIFREATLKHINDEYTGKRIARTVRSEVDRGGSKGESRSSGTDGDGPGESDDGHDNQNSGDGAGGRDKLKGKERQNAVATADTSSSSAGTLTGSTSSRSSAARPITPYEAYILPSLLPSSSNVSKSPTSRIITPSSMPSLSATREEPEETILPSGFRPSDFPPADADDFPLDREEEYLDEEELEKQKESNDSFLRNRAILRKRKIKIIPLSSTLFDMVLEEVMGGISNL